MIYLISRVFCLNFFKFSGLLLWNVYFKLQNMEFGQKNNSLNWFIWFHEFFGLDFFKFSGPREAVSPKIALLGKFWLTGFLLRLVGEIFNGECSDAKYDLNRISLLYLLSYAKWQQASSFHEFLHGKPEHGTRPEN